MRCKDIEAAVEARVIAEARPKLTEFTQNFKPGARLSRRTNRKSSHVHLQSPITGAKLGVPRAYVACER